MGSHIITHTYNNLGPPSCFTSQDLFIKNHLMYIQNGCDKTLIFKPGTHRPKAFVCDWFLEVAFVHDVYVLLCAFVCVSAPKAINN